MRIRLVQVGGKWVNLALLKLSTHHKARGDTVSFTEPNPDKAYISCIFDKDRDEALATAAVFDCPVEIGGGGVSKAVLPPEIDLAMPDYSLAPDLDCSMGFTTRGCIRRCGFCRVSAFEGPFRRVQHVREFHDPKHKAIMLLDNNILADPTWFMEQTDYFLRNKIKANFTQGIDIRLVTPEIAARFRALRYTNRLFFAYDNPKIAEQVRRGVGYIRDTGFNVRRNLMAYVLVGFGTTEEEDKARCRFLKSLGVTPFVMQYGERTFATRKLAHWANRPWIFWSCDVDELTTYQPR